MSRFETGFDSYAYEWGNGITHVGTGGSGSDTSFHPGTSFPFNKSDYKHHVEDGGGNHAYYNGRDGDGNKCDGWVTWEGPNLPEGFQEGYQALPPCPPPPLVCDNTDWGYFFP